MNAAETSRAPDAPDAATLRVRVLRKAQEALDITSFVLAGADGTPLPDFEPGAHVDVHLPGGLLRPYSLFQPTGHPGCYQIAVLRDGSGRGGSIAMHDQVHVGSELQIGRPRSLFPLAGDAGPHLLLAGGIGITPLLAMADHLHAQAAAFQLHHATRSLVRTPFLARLGSGGFAQRVHHHLDDGPAGQRLDLPALLAGQPASTHLYVCGPRGFMDAVFAAARSQGWPDAQLHSESFQPAAAPAAGAAFEVQLGRGGRVLPVAAGQSVVAALAAAGVSVLTSCEQGVCGTCLTRVLDGVPDHRDQYLTPEEQAAGVQFLPCCSRACTPRLVLDL